MFLDKERVVGPCDRNELFPQTQTLEFGQGPKHLNFSREIPNIQMCLGFLRAKYFIFTKKKKEKKREQNQKRFSEICVPHRECFGFPEGDRNI